MLDWTDSFCRQFHRLISREVLLYTEMVTSAALVRGGALHLLEFTPEEQPVALQLGGSDPVELAAAAKLGAAAGYREINLNIGCPSDRVQSGAFGAVLMTRPELVGECTAAMIEAAPGAEITVKCRLGVDDQDPAEALPALLSAVEAAGVRRVTVHARKAWLKGLSPKENREIPPLDHPFTLSMVARYPGLRIGVNGGIEDLAQAKALLAQGFDHVMIGRAAYHRPFATLASADREIFGAATAIPDPVEVARTMRPVIESHMERGGRMGGVTRHMLGLFADRPGARHWRRALTEAGSATLAEYDAILDSVSERLAA